MFERNRIAQMLRSAREERGLSLEQAASAAGIPTQYLRLLEGESNVRVGVSDELYLIPFFRKYARFVGIDAEEMLPEFLGMVQHMPGEGSPPIRLAYRPRYAWVWRPLAVVLTIAVATFLLLRQPRERSNHEETATEPSPTVVTVEPTPTPIVEPSPVAAAAPIGAPAATATSTAVEASASPSASPVVVGTGSHALTIAAKEEAWLAVAMDDQPQKQYILRTGESRTWNAERFVLSIGNSGGVVLSLDGRELPPVGKPGRVVRNLRLPEGAPTPSPAPAASPTP